MQQKTIPMHHLPAKFCCAAFKIFCLVVKINWGWMTQLRHIFVCSICYVHVVHVDSFVCDLGVFVNTWIYRNQYTILNQALTCVQIWAEFSFDIVFNLKGHNLRDNLKGKKYFQLQHLCRFQHNHPDIFVCSLEISTIWFVTQCIVIFPPTPPPI